MPRRSPPPTRRRHQQGRLRPPAQRTGCGHPRVHRQGAHGARRRDQEEPGALPRRRCRRLQGQLREAGGHLSASPREDDAQGRVRDRREIRHRGDQADGDGAGRRLQAAEERRDQQPPAARRAAASRGHHVRRDPRNPEALGRAVQDGDLPAQGDGGAGEGRRSLGHDDEGERQDDDKASGAAKGEARDRTGRAEPAPAGRRQGHGQHRSQDGDQGQRAGSASRR